MSKLIEQGTLTANGSGTPAHVSGGNVTVACSGTFGSGTMTAEISLDGGTTFVTLGTDATKTSNAAFNLVNLPDCYIRWTLTGATTPSIKWAISGDK